MLLVLQQLGVPHDDLKGDIPKLIAARDRIVHTGRLKGNVNLDRCDSILRELLSRIILTLLEYRGSYCSYLNGYEIRQFNSRG